jgi:hypothetical protein
VWWGNVCAAGGGSPGVGSCRGMRGRAPIRERAHNSYDLDQWTNCDFPHTEIIPVREPPGRATNDRGPGDDETGARSVLSDTETANWKLVDGPPLPRTFSVVALHDSRLVAVFYAQVPV